MLETLNLKNCYLFACLSAQPELEKAIPEEWPGFPFSVTLLGHFSIGADSRLMSDYRNGDGALGFRSSIRNDLVKS